MERNPELGIRTGGGYRLQGVCLHLVRFAAYPQPDKTMDLPFPIPLLAGVSYRLGEHSIQQPEVSTAVAPAHALFWGAAGEAFSTSIRLLKG